MPYIRLTLSAESSASLSGWVDQFLGLGLVSQLDPRAQLGCHPFHVTVIGGIRSNTKEEVEGALNAIATAIHPFDLRAPSLSRFCNQLQFNPGVPAHKTAVDAASPFVTGRPYGDPRPIHITLGTVRGDVTPALRSEMALRLKDLPPLQVVGVEFEDDNSGYTIPNMKKTLSINSSVHVPAAASTLSSPSSLPTDSSNKRPKRTIYCSARGCKACILPSNTRHPCFLCKTANSQHLPIDCPRAAGGCQTEGCDISKGGNLWACMQCGIIACGRLGQGRKHAEQHYSSFMASISGDCATSSHAGSTATPELKHQHHKMIEISTRKVYDYELDCFLGVLSDEVVEASQLATPAAFDVGHVFGGASEGIGVEAGPSPSATWWCTNPIAPNRISASTISVIWDRNLLVGVRGVRGRYKGYVFTQGGSIDDGETPVEAAVRECLEEAGVDVPLEHVKLLEMNHTVGRADFYCILPSSPSGGSRPLVRGPELSCQWEVIQSNQLFDMFGTEMIRRADNPSVNSGLSWVPIDKILACEADIVAKSPSIKILKKILEKEQSLNPK